MLYKQTSRANLLQNNKIKEYIYEDEVYQFTPFWLSSYFLYTSITVDDDIEIETKLYKNIQIMRTN
jgi:hypothetical protein